MSENSPTPTAHEPDCHGFSDQVGRFDGICDDWCYGCMRCEPLREGDYLVCGECFHVFRTEAELVEQDLTVAQRVAEWMGAGELLPRSASEIIACPVCAHDF